MMNTSSERLRWLIDFAQVDYDYVSKDWEWLRVKDEIEEFVGGFDYSRRPFVLTYGGKPAQLLTKQVIVELQEHVLDCLTHLAPMMEVLSEPITLKKGRPGHKTKTTLVSKSEKPDWLYIGSPQISVRLSNGGSWVITDKFINQFKLRLALVILDRGISEIANCAECGRIYYRVRKQKYCSKRCINRVSRRNWLKNPKNKKKDRQWAHERYERRVKEKTNENVKVQSRSTKGGKH